MGMNEKEQHRNACAYRVEEKENETRTYSGLMRARLYKLFIWYAF